MKSCTISQWYVKPEKKTNCELSDQVNFLGSMNQHFSAETGLSHCLTNLFSVNMKFTTRCILYINAADLTTFPAFCSVNSKSFIGFYWIFSMCHFLWWNNKCKLNSKEQKKKRLKHPKSGSGMRILPNKYIGNSKAYPFFSVEISRVYIIMQNILL